MVYIENSKKANEIDGFERGETKKKIGPKGIWGEISIQINQNYVTQKLNMFYVKLNSSSAHWFSLCLYSPVRLFSMLLLLLLLLFFA